jgi:hypothetical protein
MVLSQILSQPRVLGEQSKLRLYRGKDLHSLYPLFVSINDVAATLSVQQNLIGHLKDFYHWVKKNWAN